MAKMQKSNRIVQVADHEVNGYLARGYNQIDDNGDILKSATGGGSVSIEEHKRVLDELDKLRQAGGNNDDLKEEVKILEAENKRLEGVIKQIQQKNKQQQR